MNLNQVKKLMDRKKNSSKGENGHALIIGGSEEYVTAVTLAGIAALRAGCDQVTIAAQDKVAWAINNYSLDLMTHKVRGSFSVKQAKEMVKLAERFDCVLLGNGITRKADKFCNHFIKKSSRFKVVDADALKSMCFKDFTNCIITPHEKELEIMLVNSGKEFLLPKLRSSNAKEKALILQGNLRYFLHNNNILCLKGPTDIILSRNKISLNRTGNQGMTKAGTGDILAGLAIGFLAKSGDMYKSAVAASYINGLAGDLELKKKGGYSFIASDLLEDFKTLLKFEKEGPRKEKHSVKRVAVPNPVEKEESKSTPKKVAKKTTKKTTKKSAAKKIPTKQVSKKKVAKKAKKVAKKQATKKKPAKKVAKKKPVKKKSKKPVAKKKPAKKSKKPVKKKATKKKSKRK
jgi:hydroxyethylthiazole kinase-like uncharacterized protein yjeF